MKKQRIKFSGHQTFSFRYGWLEKGYAFVRDGNRFSDESAIVKLGVGKNMVESIKYWCEMTGIVENGAVTPFGYRLLDDNKGWDPFLEDQASWWLLHWNLITNEAFKTSGAALFFNLRKPEFSKKDVAAAALQFVETGKKAPSDSVIMRDVDCYIRAYCGTQRFEKKKTKDESFECPLQELNIIQPMSDNEQYRFAIGRKTTLPPEIIGYAMSKFVSRAGKNKHSTTIQNALYQENSPGQAFMLDENTLVEAIQVFCENKTWSEQFGFTKSAGNALIYCYVGSDDAENLLENYYRRGNA